MPVPAIIAGHTALTRMPLGASSMAQVLVRDVDPAVLKRLKRRARQQGRSLQAELKTILEQAAGGSSVDARALADNISAALAGRTHTDSVEWFREDRSR